MAEPTYTPPQELARWLDTAKDGESHVYLHGFLAYDLERGKPHKKHLPAPWFGELCAVAMMTWAQAKAGKLHLTQRRIGPQPESGKIGTFEYIATKGTTRPMEWGRWEVREQPKVVA